MFGDFIFFAESPQKVFNNSKISGQDKQNNKSIIKPSNKIIINEEKGKPVSSNKSKYFQFIDNDLVESQVISYNGTIIPLPKDWAYKHVSVLFCDGVRQDNYVKDNGNIHYVTCAKIYLGTTVLVTLLPN